MTPFHPDPLAAPGLVTLDAIREAGVRLRGVANVTPLLSHVEGREPPALLLKCENFQPGGAFKIRGAYNMIARLADEGSAQGVITYSSGNHGQAVARAARLVGLTAVVVMPTTAPAVKVDGTRRSGAEVIFEGTTSVERKARAEREAAARGLAMVPPFDHPWIIAGQGTVALEILEARPEVSAVIVPVGGGGLIAGISTAIKRTSPAVRVIGVEPAGAAKMKASVDAGRAVTLPATSSIADGLLPVRPGELTLAHVQAFVDDLITVDDGEIVDAVLWLYREARLVVEPSGAATVAAFLAARRAGRLDGFGRGPVVAVLSGGNIALDTLARLERDGAPRASGKP